MILSYRARMIIANLIDAKLVELENAKVIELDKDLIKIREFKDQLVDNNMIDFSNIKKDDNGTC